MNIDIGEWVLGHQKGEYGQGVSFALFRLRPDGSREVVELHGREMKVTLIPPGEAIKSPSFFLSPEQVQAFMNAFWEMGVRPKDKRFEREIELKDQHLQDMRRIAFKGLGLE